MNASDDQDGKVPSPIVPPNGGNAHSAEAGGVSPRPDSAGLEKEERTWALVAHASTLSTFIGIPGFIGPLIVWLVKKDELPFASAQAKEALNFQISLFVYGFALMLLFLTIIGALIAIPGFIALGILEIVFAIIASIKAGEGHPYRYPMTFRLID